MTEASSIPALVPTEWLATRLGSPGLCVIDGSWYLPPSGRSARAEYLAGHIPQAIFFDVDATSDPDSPLPHMLPSAEAFSAAMSRLGVDSEDDIVIYDGSGANVSAARVWWTFRIFGHERVAILDGGLGQWRREGRPVEPGLIIRAPRRFSARFNAGRIRDLSAMRQNLLRRAEQVVDARSAGRFAGTEPEPRPGLRGGHIPGSLNLPYTELVDRDGKLLPKERLKSRIEAAGVDLSRPVVATCGSGMTACTLLFALDLLGHTANALYDGSWTELGGRSDTPVELNPDGATKP